MTLTKAIRQCEAELKKATWPQPLSAFAQMNVDYATEEVVTELTLLPAGTTKEVQAVESTSARPRSTTQLFVLLGFVNRGLMAIIQDSVDKGEVPVYRSSILVCREATDLEKSVA